MALAAAVGAGVGSAEASFPGSPGKIAFQTGPASHEIRVIDADGSGEQTLISPDLQPENPAWSPDGKRIAYYARISEGPLYIADADGGNAQLVTSGRQPDWSPDGEKLVFVTNYWQIAVVDIATSEVTIITQLEGLYDQHYAPAWEPNGNRIVFGRSPEQGGEEELWIVDADGSNLRQLTAPPANRSDRDPDWAPDGSRIVFTREASFPNGGQLYTIDPDAGGATALTSFAPPESARGPAWSPDGKRIAYVPYSSSAGIAIGLFDVTTAQTTHIPTEMFPYGRLSWQSQGGKLVVNSTDCLHDATPGDGICDTGNTTDSGEPECTLFAAVDEANADGAKDTIEFDIPDKAVPEIRCGEEGYVVTSPVVIDGTTQPGSGKVVLSAWHTLPYCWPYERCFDALTITGGNSTVRGLVINSFGGWGIRLAGGGGNVLEGNFIGTDATGTVAVGNGSDGRGDEGGILIESADNRIGGTDHDPGVCNRSCNLVSGNILYKASDGNPPAGEAEIVISGGAATANIVFGNFIGTDVTGRDPLAQYGLGQPYGVMVKVGASNNVIGGPTIGQRNVIAAHEVNEVVLDSANENIVAGNLIGTDVSGSVSLTRNNRVLLFNAAADNVIEDNLISGGFTAVMLSGEGVLGNRISENVIGTTLDGATKLGNITGIEFLEGAGESVVQGNTVAYGSHGVVVYSDTAGIEIKGNDIHGHFDLGVWVLSTGGPAITDNTIHDNGIGIWIDATDAWPGEALGVRISRNSIHDNESKEHYSGLGIDLAPEGPTLNDFGDVDVGPNDLLNFPVLGRADPTGTGGVEVEGSLETSAGSRPYTIEFFASSACDASGYGEGERFIGAIEGATDFAGRYAFDETFPLAGVVDGAAITATAIDDEGNTSEFSHCVFVGGVTTTTLPSEACGDPVSTTAMGVRYRVVTASDALIVLKAAVGAAACDLCVCDVNGSNAITAADALLVLRHAVGLPGSFDCPPCA